MEHRDFAALWNEPLIKVAAADLEGVSLSADTKKFLVTVGLPEDAAPFLSFVLEDGLNPVREQWNLGTEFDGYWSIGSNGSGSPVCVTENDEVVYLDHEDRFKQVFINSSLNHLAECLLIYKQQIELLDDGYLEELPETWKQQTWKMLCDADAVLSKRYNFWTEALELVEE